MAAAKLLCLVEVLMGINSEETQPSFRLHTHLSRAAIKEAYLDGMRDALDGAACDGAQMRSEAEHYAATMLKDMSRDELLAHKEALENELIATARLLAGLPG